MQSKSKTMESSIDHFCESHNVPHERLIQMLNSCLTHIGQNLLFEVAQNKKDASTQSEGTLELPVVSVNELKATAKKLGLSGYSKMNKRSLLQLIEKGA